MDPLRQLQTALSDRYQVERQIGVGGVLPRRCQHGSEMTAIGTVTSRSVLFADSFNRSNATNYDVLPGGGFVMLFSPYEAEELTVLVNWKTEIQRRSGVGQR